MSISEVIELLKETLLDFQNDSHIREFSGGIFSTWKYRVRSILINGLQDQARLPVNQWDVATRGLPMPESIIDPGYEQGMYIDRFESSLPNVEATLKSIIWQLEKFGVPYTSSNKKNNTPNIFIAHGPTTDALVKLKSFLIALNLKPLVIEEEPSEGRSIDQQVEYYMNEADCAIVFGTADDKELKDGRLYPRRNVCIEIGRFQERFPNRIVYLLQDNASLPSNISEKVYARFSVECMESAYLKIALELSAFGLLVTSVPQRPREI